VVRFREHKRRGQDTKKERSRRNDAHAQKRNHAPVPLKEGKITYFRLSRQSRRLPAGTDLPWLYGDVGKDGGHGHGGLGKSQRAGGFGGIPEFSSPPEESGGQNTKPSSPCCLNKRNQAAKGRGLGGGEEGREAAWREGESF